MIQLRAVNTAADSENKIHDDAVAAQYGFRGGLVPGVTVYGYLAAGAIAHFGEAWLERGAMDVRFEKPVYEGEEVTVEIYPQADHRVRAEIAGCATGVAWLHDEPVPTSVRQMAFDERRSPSRELLASGAVLGTLHEKIDLASAKVSAPLDPSIDGRAHPAVLLSLSNEILFRNFALGPWIHVASEVRKFSAACAGESISV
ncbi:MAG TPA: MaoC family dehydratase, partial [Bryobacteraceae bacterium]|nr:MaoC family dehydratase [Bryobacteraceae bacterium]